MSETKKAAEELRKKGTGEDTILAHINPHEAEMLKLMGGMGKPNPDTGLPEYKSWFSRVVSVVLPIVIAVVAPALAAEIGVALGAAEGSVAATAVGNAVISGSTTALTGGKASDVVKSALGSAAGTAVGDVAGQISKENLGLTASQAVSKGLGQATKAIVQGAPVSSALRQAALAGSVEALAGGEPAAEASDRAAQAITKGFTATALQDIFTPKSVRSSQTAGGGTTPQSATSTTVTPGSTPGSSALGQALRTGDSGEPIFGGDKEKGGAKPTWNVESLRYMGGEGTENA
jgi:hypothetical protein